MRSLFHFPFPAQPPSQQPSPTATVSLQSEMCHRPHPAPMRRQRRSPVLLSAARPLPGPALTGPWPTVTRSQGARHTAPPSYTCCASPSASRPPCADIRVTLSRCVGPGALAGKNRTVCILFRRMREKGPLPGNIRPKCMLFEIKMATSSPHASIPGRNRAIQDAWRANLAAKAPFSRRGTRNHAWREDVASAARPFRGSGMRHAAWPNGLCALRRGPGLLAACAPPCHLACARRGLRPLSSRPRSSPPSYTRRASPSETRHAVPVPMYLATCAPHPSRQPRGPTASRKQAEQRKQLNAGIKIGSPNGDPIE